MKAKKVSSFVEIVQNPLLFLSHSIFEDGRSRETNRNAQRYNYKTSVIVVFVP